MVWKLFTKLKIYLNDLAISFLGIYHTEIKTNVYSTSYTQMLIALLLQSSKTGITQMPSIKSRVQKLWDMHTME